MSTISQLETKLRRLQRKVDHLSETYSPAELQKQFAKLADEINALQQKGYHYLADAHEHLRTVSHHIDSNKQEITTAILMGNEIISSGLKALENRLERLSDEDEKQLGGVKTGLNDLDDQLDDKEDELKSLVGDTLNLMDRIQKRLKFAEATLEKRDDAGFEFNEDEQLILADRAEWLNEDDDPDGFLYLTSERLLFEQKEKTGKMFGMFGGKMEQEVEWSHTLDEIVDATEADEGLMGRKSMLVIELSTGDTHRLEIKGGGSNDLWESLLKQVAQGELQPTQDDANQALAGQSQAVSATHAPNDPNDTVINLDNVHKLHNYQTIGAEDDSDTTLSASLSVISLSADGSRVLTNAMRDMRVWDTVTGEILYQTEEMVYSPVLGHDGTWFAVAEKREGSRTEHDIIIREVDSGDVLHTIGIGHSFNSQDSMIISPDGKYLAYRSSISKHRGAQIYDIETWQLVYEFEDSGWISFNADSTYFAMTYNREVNPMKGTHIRKTMIYNLETGEESIIEDVGGRHGMLSPDGQKLFVQGRLWDCNTGEQLVVVDGIRHRPQFTPNGQVITGAGGGAFVFFSNAMTGETVHLLPEHEHSVLMIDMSADGRVIATNSGGSMPGGRGQRKNSGVRLWKVEL